ncbi:MAG: preprotein translocase subunit SecA [Coriobacteriia bacterium]|nr:preprotein translocase subunit SecA [Coriobacteriia bacterium]
MGFLDKVLSLGGGKQLAAYEEKVIQINDLEDEMRARSDEELAALTHTFRARLEQGETLDDLLVEAFAAVREASRRVLGMRHFDVQLIGAMVLHEGQIAEMKTGEGKTLVATAAVYLNALADKGVHVVTVNEYLAKRDSEWMGRVYQFMGLDVGLIYSQMDPAARIAAYKADVTYGTNNEFGFDYLRDNMVTSTNQMVQRGHNYAIVDEVDSILIDEARTPLIISGMPTQSATTYKDFARAVTHLQPEVDFELDEAKRTVAPNEVGIAKVERLLSIDDIYADPSGTLVNHLQQALRAQFLFHRDVEYLVTDGEVLIVDQHTGRPMVGRRYSEGLHQAIEAKEKVRIQEENQTLATITLQNYFRMYDKLAGMTGTAMTEDKEFREIYKLPVVSVPTHQPMVRDDANDLVYRNVEAKYNAVADFVEDAHRRGQPCLLGTISIENSERLARILKKRGIAHNILNAKHHEKEAHIIAQAGRAGAVTIATNMAGRGTDILLGGNPDFLVDEMLAAKGISPEEATDEQRAEATKAARELTDAEHDAVVEAGGLAVLGTERHESRRIDNQLRGRSGRQGDPGLSQFYLSLEDDLMRLFGGARMERVSGMMETMDVPDDMPIQASLVSKSVESAQRQIETVHFASRKHVLEYDDVMNSQREAIYGERAAILDGKNLHERVDELIGEVIESNVLVYCPDSAYPSEWDTRGLVAWFTEFTGIHDGVEEVIAEAATPYEVIDELTALARAAYAEKSTRIGEEQICEIERYVMLQMMDARWMQHLQEMDYLKEGVGLRAIGQRDPVVEYKNEAYDMFAALVASINEDFVRMVLRAELVAAPETDAPQRDVLSGANYSAPADEPTMGAMAAAARASGVATPDRQKIQAAADAVGDGKATRTVVKDTDDPFANAGRNDPCPCGSGKKFKRCHG